MHAALAFAAEHSTVEQKWYKESNYLAWLSVRDEREL